MRPYGLLIPSVDNPYEATVHNPETGNTCRVEHVHGELWNVSMVGFCECGIIHEAESGVDASSIRQAAERGEADCDDRLTAKINSCDCDDS